MLLVAAMVVSISASAQFQEGKGYLGGFPDRTRLAL